MYSVPGPVRWIKKTLRKWIVVARVLARRGRALVRTVDTVLLFLSAIATLITQFALNFRRCTYFAC